MKLLISFIVFNAINVILQTIKSLVTVKGGKMSAAAVNAVVYAFYTYIVVLTMCELDLITKCVIVGICNFVGVWIVKFCEEKTRKDRLWKIELTVLNKYAEKLHNDLDSFNIPHNYIPNVGKYTIFNCYCATQKESAFVKEMCNRNHAKYFVSETKIL